MRHHGHNDNGVDTRIQDRSARRKRIGRGPGWRRDYQAIRTLSIDQVAIGIYRHVDYSGNRTVVEHHVIERERRPEQLPIAPDLAFEQKVCFGLVVPVEHATDSLFHLSWRNVREKTQAAAVDSEQRHT